MSAPDTRPEHCECVGCEMGEPCHYPRPDRGSDLLPRRAVWLSEDDFFDVLAGGQQMQVVRQKIIDQWDAAPADPAEAVAPILKARWNECEWGSRSIARAVLAALGCVSARETNEKPA